MLLKALKVSNKMNEQLLYSKEYRQFFFKTLAPRIFLVMIAYVAAFAFIISQVTSTFHPAFLAIMAITWLPLGAFLVFKIHELKCPADLREEIFNVE